LFEILTLVQTRKMRKRIAIVLYGKKFWDEIINFDALIRYGTISPEDIDLFHHTDTVDEAFTIITRALIETTAAECVDTCKRHKKSDQCRVVIPGSSSESGDGAGPQ
jgi:predicted Rossmann-fold nucleotide-binding protein